MSKLCASTFFWAFSIARVTHGCSMTSSFSIPSRSIMDLTLPLAKIRIRLSSSDR